MSTSSADASTSSVVSSSGSSASMAAICAGNTPRSPESRRPIDTSERGEKVFSASTGNPVQGGIGGLPHFGIGVLEQQHQQRELLCARGASPPERRAGGRRDRHRRVRNPAMNVAITGHQNVLRLRVSHADAAAASGSGADRGVETRAAIAQPQSRRPSLLEETDRGDPRRALAATSPCDRASRRRLRAPAPAPPARSRRPSGPSRVCSSCFTVS